MLFVKNIILYKQLFFVERYLYTQKGIFTSSIYTLVGKTTVGNTIMGKELGKMICYDVGNSVELYFVTYGWVCRLFFFGKSCLCILFLVIFILTKTFTFVSHNFLVTLFVISAEVTNNHVWSMKGSYLWS